MRRCECPPSWPRSYCPVLGVAAADRSACRARSGREPAPAPRGRPSRRRRGGRARRRRRACRRRATRSSRRGSRPTRCRPGRTGSSSRAAGPSSGGRPDAPPRAQRSGADQAGDAAADDENVAFDGHELRASRGRAPGSSAAPRMATLTSRWAFPYPLEAMRPGLAGLVVLGACVLPATSRADIYQYRDERGTMLHHQRPGGPRRV